ncbi:MAG: PD40 domain-containing protein [Acidobacteriia bacterium]|nr:PD40 domain-containing protein [Terriglobia bacterium]
MIGRTIRQYRITGQLGSGGMGVVYKAEDTNLDRTVALKFLAAHLLESEEHKQRFLREAKAAASLDHPNICTIYEIGETGGRVFLAIGYIDGPEVRARIKERPLKLDEALDIAIQAAEGLRAAHQKGVVHRDVKSSNLMLTSAGQVKIMDFGLAQLTGGTRLTRTDTVLGTPAYMSPEQAQRRATDQRTDIWSLGVVLYEMVTGSLPFAGEREPAVIYSIIHEPHEPLTAIRAGVPLELDRIVGKALAKKPEERYQHVDDMLVDLRALRGGVGAVRPSLQRRWLLAALIPVLLIAGFLAWRASRAPETAELPRAVALTTFPGAELYPSFSPDGNHVAFTWNGPKQDNTDIYVQQIGAGTPLRLTSDPRSDYNPVWSPDGRWIAFLRGDPSRQLASSGRELRLIPPLGGPERKLANVRVQEITVNSVSLTWCPDNKCLIVTDTTGEGKPDALYVISLETGEKRQLTNPQPPVVADTNPAWSPDGESLLFLRRSTWAFGELHVLPIRRDVTAAGEARRIALAPLKPDYATWLPDGKEVLLSAGAISGGASLYRLSLDGGSQPARLPFVGEDGVMPVVSSSQPGRPARLAYVRSFTDENIWRVVTSAPGAPASSPPAVAIASTKSEVHCQFSPDGRRVAFTSTRSGAWEIWVSDPDGSNAVQLTFLQAPTGTGVPRWSPDGQWITFASDVEGQFDIFVIPVAGGKPRNLTKHPAIEHVPSFSRDGKWIYFSSNRTRQFQVWKMAAAGGDAVQVTKEGGWVSFESLDGAWLYYTPAAAVGASLPLWRVPASGGQPVKVLDGVLNSSFALMQRGIHYADEISGQARLQFYDFASHGSTTVARNLGDGAMFGGFTAAPDGRTILYAKRDSAVNDLMLVENFR